MRKIFVIGVMSLVFASVVTAQVSVDPNDRFYQEAQIWEVRGLIERLPQIRPYPLTLVRSILETVAMTGINDDGSVIPDYQDDVELALYEYKRIFSHSLHLSAEGAGTVRISSDQTHDETDINKYLSGKAAIGGDVLLHPLVSFSYDIGEYGSAGTWENVFPQFTNFPRDALHDAAEIGPLDIYFDANSNISVGNTSVYATAGVSRVGFGPFLGDGLCLNETSYHMASIFMNATGKLFSFTTLFSAIGATTNYNADDDLSAAKYFALHSLRFSPSSRLGISFYESVVFGGRTEFLYLVPAPFMVVQGLGGNNDNLQMGLLFEYDVVKNLRFNADIFVDDFDVEKLASLSLDGKNRIGAQAGFIYTPPLGICKSFALSYTLVIPYTYSHWECISDSEATISGETFNYQNYTNNGINIGSSLDPDSDKISFSIVLQPKTNMKLTFASNFIRHQNVVESLTDAEAAIYMAAKAGTYRTDGTVYTHTKYSNPESDRTTHVYSARNNLLFMTGEHSMYTCQAGVNLSYEIPTTKRWRITLKAGYTFEYIHNKGIERNIYPGVSDGYVVKKENENEDGEYVFHYDGTDYASLYDMAEQNEELQAKAKAAYRDWVNALFDQVNNYFSFGVKVTY